MSRSGIKGVIPIDAMAQQIANELQNWSQDVADAMKEAVIETTAEAVLELKRSSPKDSGDYAKDWTRSLLEQSRYGLKYVVHNKHHYRLTHLLEHGHNNPRAVNGKTWTPAKPHIGLAEAHAMELLEEKMRQYINDVD